MDPIEKRPIVLIVDDEPSARETLEILLYQENYDLHFANDGFSALTLLKTLEPDVILLDVMMAGMTGYEVCQKLAANPQKRQIPIILITALDAKEHLIQGLRAGATEFLSKPVNGLELRTRVRSMLRIKRQYDELKQAMQLREVLSHMVVHDMRSPLTTLALYSKIYQRKALLDPAYSHYLSQIDDSVAQLSQFLDNILMLAKMEEGRLTLDKKTIALNEWLDRLYHRHALAATARGLLFRLDVPTPAYPLEIDTNLFSRVLDNLLSNAFKFAPEHSTVVLAADYLFTSGSVPSVPPRLRLRVLDEGCGISAEHRERIFDKYEIVNTPQSPYTSQIGLGLAFCKMVVIAHGGEIYVEDNQPQGAVFCIELPPPSG